MLNRLNGFLPLAYQLKNAGIDVLYPKCSSERPHSHGDGTPIIPPGPVNPLQQVKTYIDGIMDRVQPNGWVGPPPKNSGGGTTGAPTTSCAPALNLFGGDLGPSTVLPNGTADACAAKCHANPACAAYVFEQCGATNHCWLKAGGWKTQNFSSSTCALCSQVVRDLPLPRKKGDGDQYW